MSFKDLQREYDNMCEPDYPENNPAVVEMLEKDHDEEYLVSLYEVEDEAIDTLLLKIAKYGRSNTDDLIQLSKLLREHYDNSFSKFVNKNYCKYNEKWLKDQSEY